MLDFGAQKKALQARLEYYRVVFPQRSAEYRAFKQENSIPRINVALKRLDNGTYGVCTNCNEEIGELRLLAVPGALQCLTCQKSFEDKRKGRNKRTRL